MSREERFIEMLGGLDEKLVAVAEPKPEGYDLKTEHHDMDFAAGEKPETPQPTQRDIRRYRIRNAVLGGLAAALVIAAGVFVWNMVKNAPPVETKPSESVYTRESESSTTEQPVTFDEMKKMISYKGKTLSLPCTSDDILALDDRLTVKYSSESGKSIFYSYMIDGEFICSLTLALGESDIDIPEGKQLITFGIRSGEDFSLFGGKIKHGTTLDKVKALLGEPMHNDIYPDYNYRFTSGGETIAINDMRFDDDGKLIQMPDITYIGDTAGSDWGITLTAKNVTAEGMTLFMSQHGADLAGEIIYGEDYRVERRSGDEWIPVEEITDNAAWTLMGYDLKPNTYTEKEIDWSRLYGALPDGEYRIVKEFMLESDDGTVIDRKEFTAEFTVGANNTRSDPENYDELITYPVRSDQVLPIFDKTSLDIFERIFYGVWKYEGEANLADELHLTYSEDFFDYGHACYPGNIVETDELYALTYINGGELCCYTVFKNEPDVLYACSYNMYNGKQEGYETAVYINSKAPKYIGRVQAEMPALHTGKLSNLGLHRLFYELGEDFAEFYSETLLHDSGYNSDGYTDESGTSWLIVSNMTYPRDTRYLVSYNNYSDEPSVTVGIPYYEKSEYEAHDYLGEDEEVSWKKYFALEFRKKDGKWSVTHRPLEEVYEEFDTFTFAAPEAQNRMLASVVCNNVTKIHGHYSFPSAEVRVTDAKTGEKLGSAKYSSAMVGLDNYSCDGDIEVRIYSVRPDRALIVTAVPFLKLNETPMYLATFYWSDRGTVNVLNMSAPGSDIEIKSLDDISLSGNEVIYVTDSDGNELRFVVDQNGHTVLKCDDMGLTTVDKTKVYEFPIQTFADDEVELIAGEIKPAEELVEFHSYNSIEEKWDTYGAGKFLDGLGVPELKKLYYSGKFIASMPVSFFIPYADGYSGLTYFRGSGGHFEADAAAIKVPFGNTGNKATFYASGFTCDSFLTAFPKIFTDEWEPVMLERFSYGFIKYGEELYFLEGGIGGNLSHIYTEYELVKQTDNEIIFNAIAYDLDWRESMETPDAVYDPAKKDDYLKDYQVFRFVKTADGWRIAYSPTGWDWY